MNLDKFLKVSKEMPNIHIEKYFSNEYGNFSIVFYGSVNGYKIQNIDNDGVIGRVQYYPLSAYNYAMQCFINKCNAEYPLHEYGLYLTRDELTSLVNGKLWYQSHYKYLDAMLEPFWKRVFEKTPSEMYCGGIVGAHGDKAYGYRSEWEKANIPFQHGALMYLLAYTGKMDKPKSESMDWAIDNYQQYLPMIKDAEKEVIESFRTRFDGL